jgi:hypothetical protein
MTQPLEDADVTTGRSGNGVPMNENNQKTKLAFGPSWTATGDLGPSSNQWK